MKMNDATYRAAGLVVLGPALILMLPRVAMELSEEWVWNLGDFAFLGILLVAVGATLELAVRKTGNSDYRAAVGVAVAAAFFLVLVNGAVGIIGNSSNEANLAFAGVLAIGLIGALIARFRPRGMALTLVATALAQALVGAVAVTAGWGSTGPIWPRDVVGLTGMFVALWLGSAWLFREAARGDGGTRGLEGNR